MNKKVILHLLKCPYISFFKLESKIIGILLSMDFSKYKWKFRILFSNTTCYQDKQYIKSRDLYYKHINDFKIRNVKLLANRKKGLKFSINLVGGDGPLKLMSDTLIPNNLFKIIDKMPTSQKVNVS